MKKTHLIIALLLTVFSGYAQEIYTKAYGNPNDKPLLFLHGGPGYNAVSFEVTTAKALSEKGFYVGTLICWMVGCCPFACPLFFVFHPRFFFVIF